MIVSSIPADFPVNGNTSRTLPAILEEPKFTKLQLMIKKQSTISKDDREILSNIDAIYEEWRSTTW